MYSGSCVGNYREGHRSNHEMDLISTSAAAAAASPLFYIIPQELPGKTIA